MCCLFRQHCRHSEFRQVDLNYSQITYTKQRSRGHQTEQASSLGASKIQVYRMAQVLTGPSQKVLASRTPEMAQLSLPSAPVIPLSVRQTPVLCKSLVPQALP